MCTTMAVLVGFSSLSCQDYTSITTWTKVNFQCNENAISKYVSTLYFSLKQLLNCQISRLYITGIIVLRTGIFEKHKLLFSFQITCKLEQDVGNIKQEELDFFIKVRIECIANTRSNMFSNSSCTKGHICFLHQILRCL